MKGVCLIVCLGFDIPTSSFIEILKNNFIVSDAPHNKMSLAISTFIIIVLFPQVNGIHNFTLFLPINGTMALPLV